MGHPSLIVKYVMSEMLANSGDFISALESGMQKKLGENPGTGDPALAVPEDTRKAACHGKHSTEDLLHKCLKRELS